MKFGETGLRSLAALYEDKTGPDWLSVYELRSTYSCSSSVWNSITMAETLVNTRTLETFLQRLGQCFHYQAALYLVGETSLLLAAGKKSTFDIDVQFQTENQYYPDSSVVCEVSRDLGVPVELASPEQFIPLPAGFQITTFVRRYGSLDVFHFDFYSIALAKIHRGNEKDFDDVCAWFSPA